MNEQAIILLLGAGLAFVASMARRWRVSNARAMGGAGEAAALMPALEVESSRPI